MSKQQAWSFSRLNNYETCPRQYYELSVAKNYPFVESEAMRYGKEVHKALELRVGKGKKLPMHLTSLEPLADKLANSPGDKLTEQKLAINRNFEPTGYFDNDVWARCIIDLALKNNDTAVIIDYKTGKSISDDFTQLNVSAAMFMLHDKEVKECKTVYYWTKHKTLTTSKVSRAELPDLWAKVLPRIKRYEKAHDANEFPPNPSGLCRRHCVVKTCPHYGG